MARGALRRTPSFAQGGLTDEEFDRLIAATRGPESGGRNIPNRMGSGAFGPHQYMPPTWDEDIRGLEWNGRPLTADDRMVPEAQDYVMRQRTMPGYIDSLDEAGLDLTPGNVLMLHRLGRAGGAAMLAAQPGQTTRDVLSRFYPTEAALQRVFRQNPYLGSYEHPIPAADVVRGVRREAGDPDPDETQDLPVAGAPGSIGGRRTGALRQVAQAGGASDATGPADPSRPMQPVTTADDDSRIMQMRREILDNLPTPQARQEAMRRYQEATENLTRSYQARRQQGNVNVPLLTAGMQMMASSGPGGWGGVLRTIGEGGMAGARALAGERERNWQADTQGALVGQQAARFGVEEQDRQYRTGLEGLQRAEQALMLPQRVRQMQANTERAEAGAALARTRDQRLQQEQAVLDSNDPVPMQRLPPSMRHDLNVTLGRINRNQIERNAQQEVQAEQYALPIEQRMTPQAMNAEIARRRDEEIGRLRNEAFTRYNAADPTLPPQRRPAAGAAPPAPTGAGAPPISQTPPEVARPSGAPGTVAESGSPVPGPAAVAAPPSESAPPPQEVAPAVPASPAIPGPRTQDIIPPSGATPVAVPPMPTAAPAAAAPSADRSGDPNAPPTGDAVEDLRRNPSIDATRPVPTPDGGTLPPSPFAFGSPERAAIEGTQARVMTREEQRARAAVLQRMTTTEMANITQRRDRYETINQALDQFEDAMRQFRTGRTAGARVAVGAYLRDLFGIRSNTATFGELAQAATRFLQPQMRVQGSGATSDNEMRWFLQSLPNINNTPEGNQFVIDMFRTWGRYNDQLYGAFAQAIQRGNGLLGPDWFNIRDQATIRARAELRVIRSRIEEYTRNNPSGSRQSTRFAKGGSVKMPGQKGRVKLSRNFHKAFLDADPS